MKCFGLTAPIIGLFVMGLSLSTANAQTYDFNEMLRQSSNVDTGVYPAGVPESYTWYDGDQELSRGAVPPPAGFTALAGWGQVYPQKFVPFTQCNVYLKNFQTYVHKKSGGWQIVENVPATHTLGGAYFVADFKDNAGYAGTIEQLPSGEGRFSSAPQNYVFHYWTQPRGEYAADTIDGAFTVYAARTDSAGCNMVANVGIDYWRNQGAPYVSPVGTNNPAYGGSSWVKLTDQYQYLYFTRFTEAQLRADPPPVFGAQPTVDTVAPSVSISSPAANANVSDSVTLTAVASDNVGVVGVQFLVDGNNVGSEVMSSPYTFALNTTTLANGSHAITARARDAAGNVKISSAVNVNVSNSSSNPPTGGNSASPSVLLGPTMPMATTGAAQGEYYNLWSNGSLAQNVVFSGAGTYNLAIEAVGSQAGGVNAIMQVLIDGVVVSTTSVGTSLSTYNVSANISSGTHKVEIAFTNDANINGQDRNLYIKKITITSNEPVTPPPSNSASPSVLLGTTMPIATTGAAQGDYYNLWSNGSLSQNVEFSGAGTYTLAIEALGSQAGGVNAIMQVLVDDQVVSTVSVGTTLATYNVSAPLTAGIHKIGVAFTNDANINGQDRNLYIKKITIASGSAPVTPPSSNSASPSILLGTTMPIATTGAVQGDYYNLWANGSLSQNVEFSGAGAYNLAIEALGSQAGGVNAIMQVLVDDVVVSTTSVGTSLSTYNVSANIGSGTHKIGVAFTNDASINGQDRNLYIKKITITAK